MSWENRNWSGRPPRPARKRLPKAEKERILIILREGIDNSPVLSALDIRVKALRGRFYYERLWQYEDEELPEIEVIGRATPLGGFDDKLLMEIEYKKGNWSKYAAGKPKIVANAIAADSKGTFHGLGSLDASLRRESGLTRQKMVMYDDFQFVYAKTERQAAVQEALYHFFGVPIKVIAEPREWYVYHRQPEIVEVNEEKTAVLVRFAAESWMGSFSGITLYAMHDGEWGEFSIKPNQSESIASSLVWLEKRKWRAW
jgi:hypothetical protein